jgi:predicted deacylase
VAARIQRSPDEPWADGRLWAGELGTTAKKRPVKAFYFPGTTARRALVIAAVHGTERQGMEVANLLMADLKATPRPSA